MSIQDVLDDVGASRGAFYHYFDSKPALLEAVIERMGDAAIACMRAARADPDLTAPQKFDLGLRRDRRYKWPGAISSSRSCASGCRTRTRSSARSSAHTSRPGLTPLLRRRSSARAPREGSMAVDAPGRRCPRRRVADPRRQRAGRPAVRRPPGRHDLLRGTRGEPWPPTGDAFERILGLAPGSLHLVDEGILRWSVRHSTGRSNHDHRSSRPSDLTKSYGVPPRDHRARPRGRGGRGVRLPRPERRRQDDHHPRPCSTISGPTSGAPGSSASRRRSTRSPSTAGVGYLPGEFALYDKLTGGQTIEYFANLRGGVDAAYQADLDRAARHRPEPQVPRVLEGQQAEDRAGHRAPAPAGAAHPRRADLRPRSARPADLLRAHPRGQGRGPDDLPVEPHPVRGREDLRPRRRSSATAASSALGRSRTCGTSPITRSSCVFAGAVPAAAFEALPGVSELAVDGQHLHVRVSGSIAPVVRAAASYELARLRQPRAVARGDVPRRVRRDAAKVA